MNKKANAETQQDKWGHLTPLPRGLPPLLPFLLPSFDSSSDELGSDGSPVRLWLRLWIACI